MTTAEKVNVNKSDKDLVYLSKKLNVSTSWGNKAKELDDSIMIYGNICEHDDGFLCDCRLQWILDYVKKMNRRNKLNNMSNQEKLYNDIEKIVRYEKIMEKRYDIELIPESEPIFTTSQETDVWELIREGLGIQEIVAMIKQW